MRDDYLVWFFRPSEAQGSTREAGIDCLKEIIQAKGESKAGEVTRCKCLLIIYKGGTQDQGRNLLKMPSQMETVIEQEAITIH